jgi:hypothetical protein
VYVGAGVFELVPILAERILLGREIDVFTLPGPEPEELERALRLVALRTGEVLPSFRMEAFVPSAERRYGHAWLVSVLTDPDHFPALHDELYERRGSELGTGRGNPTEERGRARSLVQKLLRTLAPRALFTTTEEELAIVEPLCRSSGWRPRRRNARDSHEDAAHRRLSRARGGLGGAARAAGMPARASHLARGGPRATRHRLGTERRPGGSAAQRSEHSSRARARDRRARSAALPAARIH